MACANAPYLVLPIRGGDENVCMKFLDVPDPGLCIIVGVFRESARKSNAHWLRGVGGASSSTVATLPQGPMPNRSHQFKPAPMLQLLYKRPATGFHPGPCSPPTATTT